MGWVFTALGLVLVAIGGFVIYFGQNLLREKPPTISQAQSERILTPSQHKLLAVLYHYQRDFAATKLVIGRTGEVFFDNPEQRKALQVNVLKELYGSKENDLSKHSDFVALMESMPTEYVRFHAEARFDNPFVVSVTSDGVKYLREPK